jgi:hypothetical protein
MFENTGGDGASLRWVRCAVAVVAVLWTGHAFADSGPSGGDLVRVRHGPHVVEGYVVSAGPRIVVETTAERLTVPREHVVQTATRSWKWRLLGPPVAGAATGALAVLSLGAAGVSDVDGEAFALGVGIMGGIGLLTGTLVTGVGSRFHPSIGEHGVARPALANRARLSSLSLHGGAVKPRGFSMVPIGELRLLHEGLVRSVGFGASAQYGSSSTTRSLLVVGSDVRYTFPLSTTRPYAAASLQYRSWDSATVSGNRDKALTLQGTLGARVRPASSPLFAEVELRYAHRLATFEGDDRDGFLAGSVGAGMVW